MSEFGPARDELVAEVLRLATACLAEDATPQERDELNAILAQEPEARQVYLRFIADSNTLRGWALRESAFEQASEAAAGTPLEEGLKPASSASDSSKGLLKMSYWRGHRLQFGAVALVLTLLFWVGFFSVVRKDKGDNTPADPSGLPAGVLAQLTDVRGAVWAKGAKSYADADLLLQDESLELAGGFVEITFRDGAVVLLQGPAHFTVDTRGAGTLEHGRLVARIEKQAGRSELTPFAISTPLAQIIDLGTEFGVEAESDGTTQVDVFQGRVEATPQGEAKTARSRPLFLTQGQSARIAPGESQFNNEQAGEYIRELPEGDLLPVALPARNVCHFEPRGAGNDGKFRVYAVHSNRQEFSFILFDVSNYYGSTAVGSGQFTLTIAGGDGAMDPGSFELELRQLNRHNAGMLPNVASLEFLDGTTTPWRDNSGTQLEDLNHTSAVLDITSAVIDSQTGPFGGDTPTTEPAPGTQVVFTVPQQTLQSWLDQTALPIVVIDANTNSTANPRIGYLNFGDGTTQPLPTLEFQVIDPAGASPPARLQP